MVGFDAAACVGRDPTLWDLDHANHRVQFDRCDKCSTALRVCADCPVRISCAAVARQLTDVETIRGGWVLVYDDADPAGELAPATPCEVCGLPVLRGGKRRHCSTRCVRWALAQRRREARVAA